MALTELYLIRHGLAGTRQPAGDDERRPLTGAGVRRTRAVARQLVRAGLRFDRLVTSPLARARQTADILRDCGLARAVEESDHLRPGGNLRRCLESLAEAEGRAALVGHEPDLSTWAERLVWNAVRHRLVLKKAGVIGLGFPGEGSPLGRCQLFLLVPPRLLV